MKQNIYDDPDFFAQYSTMPRSLGGLEASGEWHAFRGLLPSLEGARVLDLGCGFGWHCRYAREQRARSVIGIDLSEKMLERARQATDDPQIEYRNGAIEDVHFPANEFDVVMSSLAIHYVQDFDLVCQKVRHCLKQGGSFIFSVEHPIFTSREAQDWFYGPSGERVHWPVDNYQSEGRRNTSWLAEGVVKYHRKLSTYINGLIAADFAIKKVLEPEPPRAMLEANPKFKDELRRPMFLLISVQKI